MQNFLDGREFFAARGLEVSGIILGVDFIDLQESVFFLAEVDESGLQISIDVVNDAPVDVALDFFLVEHVEIIFFEHAVIGEGDFHLFTGEDADIHAASAGGTALLLGSRLADRLGPDMLRRLVFLVFLGYAAFAAFAPVSAAAPASAPALLSVTAVLFGFGLIVR